MAMERLKVNPKKVYNRPFYHTVKRLFDIVASAIGLVLLSPLFLYLIIRIRHEDGGPAFYSQERIGKNEKPFRMWKFRSMVVNADKMLDKLEDQNEVNGAMFKIKDDPRITKIGHMIRKYSLDELPQLYNVLIGDMSLVGPRPPLPSEVEEYTDYDKQRLLVMPGCTGLWQVTRRNEADFDEMVWLDIVYINHSGLWEDFKLIIKTVLVPMPNTDGYMPVLVGAAKNYKPDIKYQRDDEGDNISFKNPNYNELTAVYWAWKNLENVDAVGLVHYRRLFFDTKPYTLSNVISIKKIEELLTQYDVILPKKRNYYIETNYSHYIHAHHREPLDRTRDVVAQNYPQYLSNFDKAMHRRKAHMFNMFIMRKKVFESYCNFVFGVLSKLENIIDISNYSVQEARVYGYISELLMDVWLETNGIKYVEMPWGQIGGKNNVKKAIFLIKRKMGIKTKTHF